MKSVEEVVITKNKTGITETLRYKEHSTDPYLFLILLSSVSLLTLTLTLFFSHHLFLPTVPTHALVSLLFSSSPSKAADPALSDPALLRKLRSNREVALSRLEEVVTKYAVQQEDTEELDRQKRLEKGSKEKEV